MDMNTSIRRLMYTFISLFLLVSLVMVNVMVFQAPQLQASAYNSRSCLARNQPFRGTIYDRNGVKLVWTVQDDNAQCGYRRVWNPDAVNAGLAPLIGYFSYRYGASGVESTYNDMLLGTGQGSTLQSVANRLLHKQVIGSDLYLTIDLKLQEQANALYNQDAETGGVCQTPGTDPPGSITVENPQNGEILAMVNHPFYDPTRISDEAYWQQLNSDHTAPLLNHATQGLYAPGSTFKTMTLMAGIDTTQVNLNTTYTLDNDQADSAQGDGDQNPDQDEALYYTVPGQNGGETIVWYDYFPSPGSNGWVGINTPVTLQDGFAYSDNVIFARVAVGLGADTWLSYVRKFGIATPGTPVAAVPFDSAFYQSRAYNPGTTMDNNLLAESGFGQGQLLITPLTMAEVTSAMAANGNLYIPHVLLKSVAHDGSVTTTGSALYGGAPVVQPTTAAAVRGAMRAVVQYGTAFAGQSVKLADSPAIEGGKTGTAESSSPNPQTWWISMAPAVNDVNTQGQLVVVVMKEHSGEGACQIFVADDVYKCAAADHDWTPPNNADLGACPAKQ